MAKAPTETEEGIKTYKCEICSYGMRTEKIEKLSPSHKHNYSIEWKTDNKNHWKECDCGDKSDIAEHTEDRGTVTKAPTETEEGIRTYKCEVCGYEMRTEKIDKLSPSHTHKYGSKWKIDFKNHWHECECGEKTDISTHIEDSGTVTKTPTETEEGIREYKCEICGYEMRTEKIDKLPPSREHSYGTDWKMDKEKHWKECSCGDKSNIAEHTEDSGSVVKTPTKTEP